MTVAFAGSQQPSQPEPVQGGPTTRLRKRDRYIDSLRALALIRVMTYHAFGWVWLPILFPSIGIMFALAGSLIAGSLDRSPGNPWRVLRKRGIRLLPPLWLMGLILVPTMLVAGWTYSDVGGAPLSWKTLLFWILPISDPPGSLLGVDWVVPLWYIRAYLWFLLLSPATLWLFRHWPKRMMAIPVTIVLLSALGLLPLDGRSGDVVLTIAMFGGCWMLGFAHHDHKIRQIPMAQALLGGISLMTLGLVWAFTHLDPVSSYDIDNIPVADTLYSLGAVLILLRFYPDFAWMDKHLVLDKLIVVINSRAMTIYLWGNFAIFAATPLLDFWSVTKNLDNNNTVGYLATYLMSWLVVIFFVFALGWCEDVAARRQPRISPWPRSAQQLETMRTRRVLTFPHPRWLAEVPPRRLFAITAGLLASAIGVSAAALLGTNTPGRASTADAPSRVAIISPRPGIKPPANLGQGNGQPVVAPTPERTPTRQVTVPPPVTATSTTTHARATRPAIPLPKTLPTVPVPVPRPPAPTTQPAPAPTTQPAPVPTTQPAPVPTTQPAPVPTTQPATTPTNTIQPPP